MTWTSKATKPPELLVEWQVDTSEEAALRCAAAFDMLLSVEPSFDDPLRSPIDNFSPAINDQID
jgi:hypothetical protein